jgi:predicted nicotinamide N-methyase
LPVFSIADVNFVVSRGTDMTPILAANGGDKYDFVVASECLWRHEQHAILVSSMAAALKPGGSAILTYSHHITGLEAEDDNFFEVATAHGFIITKRTTLKQPQMWSDSKQVDMYICEMVFQSPPS